MLISYPSLLQQRPAYAQPRNFAMHAMSDAQRFVGVSKRTCPKMCLWSGGKGTGTKPCSFDQSQSYYICRPNCVILVGSSIERFPTFRRPIRTKRINSAATLGTLGVCKQARRIVDHLTHPPKFASAHQLPPFAPILAAPSSFSAKLTHFTDSSSRQPGAGAEQRRAGCWPCQTCAVAKVL
jgi:hypothetical protein